MDAERLLACLREIVQREIYPVRQRVVALGLGNAFSEGRLSEQERLECWTLMERLLGENTRLIQLLGIAGYVGDEEKEGTRTPPRIVERLETRELTAGANADGRDKKHTV